MSSSLINHGRALRLSAMKFKHHPAIVYANSVHTYWHFNRQVNVFAHWLSENGVSPLSRVLIVSSNSPDYLRVMFACAKLGLTTIPVNTMLRGPELAKLIEVARPGLVLTSAANEVTAREAADEAGDTGTRLLRLGEDTFSDDLDHTAELRLDETSEPPTPPGITDDDPATILFTSGSSGSPKGVIKSYANLMWHALNRQLAQPRHTGDVELFTLPLTGVAFPNFVLTDLLVGATCVLEPVFDPVRASRLLAAGGITHAFLAPTMIMAISRVEPDLRFPSVRVLETAYEISMSQRAALVRQFPNAEVLYSYGQTEGSMARSPADRFLTDLSNVGYASGLDEYLVETDPATDDGVGEILVAGPTVMSGYLGDAPSPILTNGWLRTGDLGSQDDEGAVHFVGRLNDVIKSGGLSVHAADVESGLREFPKIDSVAVIGLPDEYWGEAVVAVVASTQQVTGAELQQHAARTLAPFQRPKRFLLADEIPLNPTGKVAKGELRRMIEDGTAIEVWRADREETVD